MTITHDALNLTVHHPIQGSSPLCTCIRGCLCTGPWFCSPYGALPLSIQRPGPIPVQSPAPSTAPSHPNPPQQHLVDKTGDMFNLVHLRTYCANPQGADVWWLATEACIVGEQVVHILLGCFLVTSTFNDLKTCPRNLNTRY